MQWSIQRYPITQELLYKCIQSTFNIAFVSPINNILVERTLPYFGFWQQENVIAAYISFNLKFIPDEGVFENNFWATCCSSFSPKSSKSCYLILL